MSTWKCEVCTLDNKAIVLQCAACLTARPQKQKGKSSRNKKNCEFCTAENALNALKCQVCEAKFPKDEKKTVEDDEIRFIPAPSLERLYSEQNKRDAGETTADDGWGAVGGGDDAGDDWGESGDGDIDWDNVEEVVPIQRQSSQESVVSDPGAPTGDLNDMSNFDIDMNDSNPAKNVDPDLADLPMGVDAATFLETKEKILSDIYEVEACFNFHGAVSFAMVSANQVHVRLGMSGGSIGLNREQALAWSVDIRKLFVVQLEFDLFYWKSSHPPKITVGQAETLLDKPTDFSLAWTVTNRLKEFMKQEVIDAKLDPRPWNLKEVMQVMEISGEKSFLLACLALCKKRGNLSDAALMMVEDKKRFIQELRESSSLKSSLGSTKFADEKKGDRKGNSGGVLSRVESFMSGLFSSNSEKKKIDSLVEAYECSRGVARKALELEDGNADAASELLSTPLLRSQLQAMLDFADDKSVDMLSEGYLMGLLSGHNMFVRILQLMENTIKYANKYCLVCGDRLEFEGLRPDLCSKPLCQMAGDKLGFSLSAEIAMNPELIDLLISFVHCAIAARRMIWVKPLGIEVEHKDGTKSSFRTKSGDLDEPKLKKVLDLMPSMEEMKEMVYNYSLLSNLEERHCLLYPLLRWIITSNRAHLRMLAPDEQIKEMSTPYQFVLLSSSPEKEVKFTQLRERAKLTKGGDGSIFAFHGSNTGNWHSILRTGLKNLSNTSYMTAGAALGAGIYFATNSATSSGYCAISQGWSKSMFSANFQCMAMCEIIDKKEDFTADTGQVYVVPIEDYVTTRFFFVWPNKSGHSIPSAQISSLKIPRLA